MKHPDREELVSYACDELAPEPRATLEGHLASCAECRTQLAEWRCVRRELDAWQIPERRREDVVIRGWQWSRPVRWAAAAAIVFGVGFALARYTQPAPDAAALRASLAADLRRELRTELARLDADQTERQARYQEALTKALGRLEAQRLVDYAWLREDLETVAAAAEDEINSTREDLYRLAAQNP